MGVEVVPVLMGSPSHHRTNQVEMRALLEDKSPEQDQFEMLFEKLIRTIIPGNPLSVRIISARKILQEAKISS